MTVVLYELVIGFLIVAHWQGVPQANFAVTETKLLPAESQKFLEFLNASVGSKATLIAEAFES